jgi:protein-disulfide isomerase
MTKKLFILLVLFFNFQIVLAEKKIQTIYEGNLDAKVKIIVFESLTCGACGNFHKNVYPDLKKDFIDNGLVKIEFRNFPLDLAAFNASKIAHCRNDGKSKILHSLFENQSEWVKGQSIEDLNKNLKKFVNKIDKDLDIDACLIDKDVENYILNDRIKGVKNYEVDSTPTLIINDKKFDNPQNYKKLKKTLEKMI